MIFISYSLAAISFNSCENDEKLSTLATIYGAKIYGGYLFNSYLSYLSYHVGAHIIELLLKSLEEVSRHGWYLFIFGCSRGVDISGLLRFLYR